jgi:hypothetical protein
VEHRDLDWLIAQPGENQGVSAAQSGSVTASGGVSLDTDEVYAARRGFV